MNNKKYVIDTNILISRLLIPNSIPAQVVRHILNEGTILISDPVLEELSTVILRKKFDKYVSLEARNLFIEGLRNISTCIKIERTINICRDAKDNNILELAANGLADFIITGDQDLLVLEEFENTKIYSPKNFMRLLYNRLIIK